MDEKDFGDLRVRRREDIGGFEIHSKTKKKVICFFNEKGMIELGKWIQERLDDDLKKED